MHDREKQVMTWSSLWDQHLAPNVWLLAQLLEHRTGIVGHRFKFRCSADFFQALLPSCLNWWFHNKDRVIALFYLTCLSYSLHLMTQMQKYAFSFSSLGATLPLHYKEKTVRKKYTKHYNNNCLGLVVWLPIFCNNAHILLLKILVSNPHALKNSFEMKFCYFPSSSNILQLLCHCKNKMPTTAPNTVNIHKLLQV